MSNILKTLSCLFFTHSNTVVPFLLCDSIKLGKKSMVDNLIHFYQIGSSTKILRFYRTTHRT